MPKTETPKRTEVVRVRITPEEREFLEHLAATTDRTVSSLIRIAIHGYYIKDKS